MFHFSHRNIDLLVTPGHRMWGCPRKQWKLGEREFKVFSADRSPCEFIVDQSISWSGNDIVDKFVLPEYVDGRKYKWQPVVIDIENWLAFFGIWLAEGDCGCRRVKISQNMGEIADKIDVLLKQLPWHVYKTMETDKLMRFRINSAQLADYLARFGKSIEKYIPEWIKGLSPRLLKTFLHWFHLGDGSITNGWYKRYHTSSKRLADDLQEMVLKAGSTTYIGVSDNNRNFETENQAYVLVERGKGFSGIRDRNKKKINYDGSVGCAEVSTGLLFVRRNGRVA